MEAWDTGYDLHIVRTREWTDAEKKPILKSEIDALVASDPELRWSKTDYMDMRDLKSGKVTRYFIIAWKGTGGFWWYRDQILCKDPNEPQQSKLVKIARSLKAFAIGDEGERYDLVKGLFGGQKLKVIPYPD